MLNHAFIIQVQKDLEFFGRIVMGLVEFNHHLFVNVDKNVCEKP